MKWKVIIGNIFWKRHLLIERNLLKKFHHLPIICYKSNA